MWIAPHGLPWKGPGVGRTMRVPTGRTDRRIPKVEAVEVSALDASRPTEAAATENVSSHGARVLTKQPWRPGEGVRLKSLRSDFQSLARVVYCQRLAGNVYAVGLALFTPTGEWGMPL